jgi:hypothetical protein
MTRLPLSVTADLRLGIVKARLYWIILALVLATTAGVLFFLAGKQRVSYDSHWHVFIARQDIWSNFWLEVYNNAHPPLFYLLLRATASFLGLNILAYRLVSVISMVISTALIAMIVRRTTFSTMLAIGAAAAFGLSFNAVMIALEVRAYALCTAFILGACVFYVDWLKRPAHRLPVWNPIGFAAALTGALLSNYCAFFFLAAAMITPVICALIDSTWRRRLARKIAAHPMATIMMFCVPAAIAGTAYYVHVNLWPGARLVHVGQFLFDPARETRMMFLARNTANLVRLFLPQPATVLYAVVGSWLSIGVVAVVCSFGVARLVWTRSVGVGSHLTLMFVVMLSLNAVAGLAARYPYGGEFRQEFFLVPFGVVIFFGLVRVLWRSLPSFAGATPIWAGVIALGVCTSVLSWMLVLRISAVPLFQQQMDRFNDVLGMPKVVLVDQFSLINFFAHHHDWQWKLLQQRSNHPMWQVWLLQRNSENVKLCRDRHWALDMSKPESYSSIEKCLEDTHADRVAVFRTQLPGAPLLWDPSKTSIFAYTLGDQAGLTLTVLEGTDGDVFAEFIPLNQQPGIGRINVIAATYGDSCWAPVGNATLPLQRDCERKRSCAFLVDVSALGDPSPGCAKDFVAAWRCDDSSDVHEVRLSAEAGFGSIAQLACAPASDSVGTNK